MNGTSERWSRTAMAFHWIGAFLIIALSLLGFIMTDLPDDSGSRLLMSRAHTVGGVLLMLLTVKRLVSRRRGPKVEALPLPALHRKGIAVTHGAMYLTTFALGLSGFLTGARSLWPDYVFGDLARAPVLNHLVSREAHEVLVVVLMVLIVLHVGGVMLQEIQKRRVLRRMVSFMR